MFYKPVEVIYTRQQAEETRDACRQRLARIEAGEEKCRASSRDCLRRAIEELEKAISKSC